MSALTIGAIVGPSIARADQQAAAPPPTTAVVRSDDGPIPEVIVRGEREPQSAASRVHVGRTELELRPRLRPADLLEAVPGLFAVQHAGGGKANQYFLRGFDADHGTDIAFSVDGVPVNMVSHAHGQGFSDLHFLIPELVVGLDGFKGPYYAAFGDFATAGAVNLRMAQSFDESYAQLSLGQYGIRRALVVGSPRLDEDWRAVVAAEVYADDGPFKNPERLERLNLFTRVTHDLGPRSDIALTWMSYGSRWHGSGQIPARAVCGEGEAGHPPPSAFGQPCIDPFGFVDPSEGGATQRHMLSASLSTRSDDADLTAMLYATQTRFTLHSNFTFFDKDPVQGDAIEQVDGRVVVGADIRTRRHVHWAGTKLTSTLGVQARHDTIDNALHHDRARVRLASERVASIAQSALGVFAEEEARVSRLFRVTAGVRLDRIDAAVEDHLASRGGGRASTRVSPKIMATLSPLTQLDLYADFGRGFHSNDARGVVLGPNGGKLMTSATGYELGARLRPLDNLMLTAAAFLIDLESEIVWSGDEGTTEASGATRRYGLELGARYHLANWLFADFDATFAHAAYRDDDPSGQAVPLAPRRAVTAGLGARTALGSFTPFGSVRFKALADRPASQDEMFTARGFSLVDLNAGLRWKSVEGAIDVQNLLNARWREVSFANSSRLTYEPESVTGIHGSPGWPRTIMGRLSIYY